ncbi:MAG TPA: proprotein convertase P-domain-containing protein, partial [Candidatus Acidoferrum sp.]|nr:proprotein convertase P-domain-containing protein [Candidatus Acidoferrum sp.]
GGVRITNETLELNSVGEPGKGVLHSSDYAPIWKGQVILHQTAVINTTTNTTYENWASVNIEGNVSGPGGITKTGPGTLIFLNFGVNSYEGTTIVNGGRLWVARLTAGGGIPGDLIVGDGIGGPGADVVEVGGGEGVFFSQITTNAHVHINSSGLITLDIHSGTAPVSLTGSGRLDIDSADTFILGAGNSSYTFDGVISGSGILGKGGNGTVTLNGTNTFTGDTSASSGTLLINGGHLLSPITVAGNGRLGGNGRVSELTAYSTTRILPGTSPGRLRASNVELRANSILDLELNGPDAGTNYDQLAVSGSLSVSNAELRVALNHLPTEGQVFKIIDKTSAGPVLGTFAEGGEGDVFYFGGFDAVLSYVGGDGNDVTLTITNRFVEFYNAEITMGNGNGFIDPTECNHLKIFVRNISGAPVSITNLRLDSDTPGLIITAQEWTGGTVANNALFSNARPVQFRTTPEFPCGTTANFSLTLSANAYKLRIPFSIYVPANGGYFGFSANDTPQSIPDGGSLISTIPVPTNATLSLLNADRVEVFVHATHPRASDLTFRLITPGGTNILLSANRGGAGTNYGTGCTFSNLTFFSDTAPLAIAAGTAPFVGSFRPEQPFSLAQGEPLSGTWQLMVEDSVGGNAGTLECWFLRLIPPFCQNAGGGCESCFGPIAGTLSTNQMPERLRLSGDAASVCGWTKTFAGTNATPGPFRYATHLFTNTGPAACLSVFLKNTCADTNSALMASAYTNFFNPANIRTNYVGDTGLSNALNGQFSFRVISNQVFAIVVNDTQPVGSNLCSSYTLEVFGMPCAELPRLDITRDVNAGKVRLHWSTAYPDHLLDREPVLTTPPSFVIVTNPADVVSGKYSVTNSMSVTQGFYRLRKP